MNRLAQEFASALSQVRREPDRFAVEVVDLLLRMARQQRASDIHLLPLPEKRMEVLWRIDGVLTPIATLSEMTANVVSRLKVMGNLLTYRTDIPQEGRLQASTADVEMRISTFPTVHGEKAVVRLFVASGSYRYLEDLGLGQETEAAFSQLLRGTSGVVLIAGPAGAGKTTTLYASLRTIQRDSALPRSICTLEDPVEALLPGVSQSQVKPGTEFTYQRGLASLMRQDPDVIMVGEIRDQETAQTVFQASLTGQLVLTSFHAGSAAEALSRVSDMGIEPYVIRSGLACVLAQRLMRKRCSCLPAQSSPETASATCPTCHGCGHSGRMVVAELLTPATTEVTAAILQKLPASELHRTAVSGGMSPLRQLAANAVAAGLTTQLELYRVFGPDV